MGKISINVAGLVLSLLIVSSERARCEAAASRDLRADDTEVQV